MSYKNMGSKSEISRLDRLANDTETERVAKNRLIEEARRIRLNELERIRQQEEDSDSSSRNHVSHSRYSSRHSSIEPSSVLSNNSRGLDARELKLQLISLEDKYKEVMVANAQLDSEKQLLRYEVDLMKDKLEDYIDSNQALSKCASERKREIAYQKMQISEFKHRLDYAKVQIEARDKLLTDYGLLFYPSKSGQDEDESEEIMTDIKVENGQVESSVDKEINIPGLALVSKGIAEALTNIPGKNLEDRLEFIFKERNDLKEKIEALETNLEEQKEKINIAQKYDSTKSRINGFDSDEYKQIQNAKAQAQEFKFKYQEALQKVSAKEGDIIRLEAQVKRYKAIAETCEVQEEELKQDRRKLQRDLRERNSQIEDLKSENSTLTKKLEKLSRNAGITIPGISVVAGSSANGSIPRSYRESSQAR